MPFSNLAFEPIGGTAKGANTPTVWSYKTPDTWATVRASGYFNAIASLLRAGDLIIVLSDTGTTQVQSMVQVAAVTAGVVTTASAGFGPGGATPVVGGRIAIQAVAQANTDFTLAIPSGATIMRASTITTTAFTGTTATFQLGSTAGGADLVAAVSIAAATRVSHTLAVGGANFGTGTLFGRLVQTGPSAVGTATCVVEYLAA